MTSTVTAPEVADPELDSEPPEVAHIVARDNDADADTLVTTALIEGTPLEALCGKVFVPSRDPQSLPPCEPCVEIVTEILRMRDALS